ncbi:aminotransferase class I/II-fold pyridoxal phosphate-dependent enzyme [Acidaminobacter sp. JC074]|uniref:aminotransferase class I/II-fold pyridoxal phosphate-dependent enzyme n=1 Tax=Acidaminobacter sp. JC074 TaxID=2530199 RepID=UPI001F0F05A7|nr:aminotransferase class I/II-fold pyridoxal phosphate-dependent enzyme [Acidaminobacter sp. JC074]MCH4888070.1 aminotransferase class I/II-fold pyridoxal phosphate-dependent enzyme [Acidaminobacter sp. JC074]
MRRHDYKLDHSKLPLYAALQDHIDSRVIPFDVPGHKRGRGNDYLRDFLGKSVMAADVNSMKPLDFICNPISVIKEAEDLMADAYGADEAFFIVNGTSQAVQSMVMSAVSEGDTIIMPRNVHKSAINALILSGAIPHYIYPHIEEDYGMVTGLSLKDVERAVKEAPHAKAIFIINPTYYGVVSELEAIIELTHKHDMHVIVDEAHGAHFPFHDDFPCSAIALGADMVASSLHKTGGSLTQSSVLLLNNGRILRNHVKTIINLTQTTSASYILMTSLDLTRKYLVDEGKDKFDKVIALAESAREKINRIDGLTAFDQDSFSKKGCYGFDKTKLGINVTGIGLTGLNVYEILRDDYNIQIEMGDAHNILAILSIGDSDKEVNQLVSALYAISNNYRKDKLELDFKHFSATGVKLSPRQAFYSEKERLDLSCSVGRISGEFVMIYPPGIPILAPGEHITKEIVDYIQLLKKENGTLSGLEDTNGDYIYCIKED